MEFRRVLFRSESHEARAADPAARGRGVGRDLEGRLSRGYLGLGSNVGDRLANLRAAADELPVVARSSVYETAPQGEVLDQPDFLNAAVAIEWDDGPEELLALCKDVERRLGRDFGAVRHGPRVVDVDVLLLGDLSYSSERLTLPHPEVR